MKTGIFYLVVLLAASQMAAADGMSDAFGQGKAMGAAGKSVVQSNITAGQGASIVPNYGSTAPESSYFGLSALAAPAANKIVGCATGPKSSSAYLQQECDAVNFLNKNPYQRKHVDIGKSDPLLKNSRQIMKDPTRFANLQDSGIYSQCKTSTVTAPPTYKTDVCHSTAEVATQTCSTSKQFATNCAGTIVSTPTHTTQQTSYAATSINQVSAPTLQAVQSCTNMCQVNNCTSSWSPSPYAVCSSYSTRRNQIISLYQSWLGRCADQGGLDWFDGSGANMATIQGWMLASPERASWQATGFATQRSLPGFCGGNLFQNPNLCLSQSCSTSTYPASSCTTWSAGFICSGTSLQNTIIGYYTTYLGRCAESTGLDYYVNLYNTGTPLSTIQNMIANSSEAVYYASQGRPYERSFTATCGSSGTLAGTNMCKTCGCASGSMTQQCSTTYQYNCPIGSTLSGSNCLTPTLTCQNGGSLSGSTCTTTQDVYTCPDTQTLNGGQQGGASESIYYSTIQPLTCASGDAAESAVIASFKSCLGRCPEIPGLTWWATKIKTGAETNSSANDGICASPEAQEWTRQGKPTTRKILSLCDADKFFINYDQCRKTDVTYTSSSPISNAQCSGSVDYADTGQGCAPGTSASRITGYVQISDCQTNSGSCMTNSSICTPGSTVVNGVPVTDPCMTRTDNKTCLTGGTVDDCNDLKASASGCIQQSSKCIYPTDGSACKTTEYQYKCKASDGLTKSVQDCGDQKLKLGQYDFDTAHPPDADFARVIAGMEMVREAGLYMDPATMQLFKGFDNRCTKGYAGLKKCCKTSGGGGSMSNSAVFSIGSQVVSNGASYAAYKGTPYVYDALYALEAPWASAKAASMVGNYYGQYGQFDPATGGFEAAFNPSLSLYGITWTTASTVPAATLGTNIGIGGAGEVLGGTMYFNPYIMGAQIVIMVIQELISCTQDEQMLGMKRGQNLCHFAGSYCSNELNLLFTKVCLETTDTYCCFNSRLARILNEQGRGQLGKDWGSGESPNCSGFTADQLQNLDFGKMDLSEFYAEIIPKMPDTTAIGARNQQMLQQRVQSYYSQ